MDEFLSRRLNIFWCLAAQIARNCNTIDGFWHPVFRWCQWHRLVITFFDLHLPTEHLADRMSFRYSSPSATVMEYVRIVNRWKTVLSLSKIARKLFEWNLSSHHDDIPWVTSLNYDAQYLCPSKRILYIDVWTWIISYVPASFDEDMEITEIWGDKLIPLIYACWVIDVGVTRIR